VLARGDEIKSCPHACLYSDNCKTQVQRGDAHY
jgi:hypothetical protein